jgi:carbamoyl-phosphate synthase large subunit
MVSSAKTVRICQDKSAFVSFCVEQRFPVPLRYTRDGARGAKFPLFLKPRFGKGGMGARRIFTENELRDITESDDECIIQEFVSAPEYTIDLFADFNGRVLSAVPRLRQLVIGGESYVSRTVNEPRLIEESMRLATALDLTGHCTIQCFWDSHELKFIEVNPRFGGGTALSIAAGADSPSMLVQLLAGEDVPDRIGKFVNDLVMLRFTDDLFLKAGMMPAQPPGEPELCSSSKSPHTQP